MNDKLTIVGPEPTGSNGENPESSMMNKKRPISIAFKVFLFGGIFALGLLVGVGLMYGQSVKAFRVHYNNSRTMFIQGELDLARAARANGNKVLYMAHLHNAVRGQAEKGITIFNPDRKKEKIILPLALMDVEGGLSDDAREAGIQIQKLVEAIMRGKLALAYEELGMTKEAAEQWQIAHALRGAGTLDDTKAVVVRGIASEDSIGKAASK